MSHTFSRQQLYDLVWSEPMRNLARKYNISDRGLAKACAAADIPVPHRGYWNKLQSGKRTEKRAFPPRGLGKSDTITIGGNRYGYHNTPDIDHLNAPIPPLLVFETDMDVVRAQVTAAVKKAPLPKTSDAPHHLVAKLLSADEDRRQKTQASPYPSSWNRPVFDTDFERRRLKILNGLITCLAHCGMKSSVHGQEARSLSVLVGEQHVSFTLDSVEAEKQIAREKAGSPFVARGNKDKMRLTLSRWRLKGDPKNWLDKSGDRIENHLQAIAIELIVAGETSYRQGQIDHRAWRIERKAAAEEKEIQQRREAERKHREREERFAKERVDHLLEQASAFHKAAQIRAFAHAVGNAIKTSNLAITEDELASWKEWAIAQADRIDPVVSGAFHTRLPEPND